MPRKKNYDENVALEKAMLVFWEKGYKGITTRELAQAMGINQFSLYASFENKEELFNRALAHYHETIIEQGMILPFSGEHLTLDDLRCFLEQLVDTSESDYPNGCFMCASMIDVFHMNDQVDALIYRYKNVIITAFRAILGNTFPEADEVFIDKKSEFLFGAFLGLVLQKRMGVNGAPIQYYVDEVMKAASTQ